MNSSVTSQRPAALPTPLHRPMAAVILLAAHSVRLCEGHGVRTPARHRGAGGGLDVGSTQVFLQARTSRVSCSEIPWPYPGPPRGMRIGRFSSQPPV